VAAARRRRRAAAAPGGRVPLKPGDAFPPTFLKAGDLNGQRAVVIVSHVKFEDIGGDHRPVVYFKGKTKGLVLNKTNGNMIAEISGDDDTDNWGGTRLVLYPTRVDFQGKRVDRSEEHTSELQSRENLVC